MLTLGLLSCTLMVPLRLSLWIKNEEWRVLYLGLSVFRSITTCLGSVFFSNLFGMYGWFISYFFVYFPVYLIIFLYSIDFIDFFPVYLFLWEEAKDIPRLLKLFLESNECFLLGIDEIVFYGLLSSCFFFITTRTFFSNIPCFSP